MASYKDYLKELERIANDEKGKHIVLLENEITLLSAESAERSQEKNELSIKFNELRYEYSKLKLQYEKEREENIRRAAAENAEQREKYWQEIRKAGEAEKERKAEEERKQRIEQGLCPHCGGKMGGLFTKKCKSCGKEY